MTDMGTNPKRGPLLIIEGEKDHVVPWAIANGWQDVSDTPLAFVQQGPRARLA